MGYFSSGTEGLDYEHRYCRRCVHRGDDESGCPVYGVHFFYNYDQNREGGEKIKDILNMLIPTEGIQNEECAMFYPDPDPEIDQNPDAPLHLYVGSVTEFSAPGAQE